MPKISQITSGGMLRVNTPTVYHPEYNLWVKREDLSCLPPGPPFSKTRGVYARVASRSETVIGVLDTYHSQAGHAVARACQVLGKTCWNFYPKYKADSELALRSSQQNALALGAKIVPLPAGRSCILYHAAKKATERACGYMMPNALKLPESVIETSKEVGSKRFDVVLIPCSSGTIAAGVVKGFRDRGMTPRFILHMGYSRSESELIKYVKEQSGYLDSDLITINEGYQYKDRAKDGETPTWPCNPYYDLKAFRWWLSVGRRQYREALLWNIG